MRLLRLTNSDDLQGTGVGPQGAGAIAARLFEARFGTPLESIAKVAWPTERMAEFAARSVEEVQPDLVLFRVNGYWVTHESVPLKLQRRFGRAGKRISAVGEAAGHNHWLAERRGFQLLRRWLLRTVGGATLFTTPEILPRIEATLRRIAQAESCIVVVRGPYADPDPKGTARAAARAQARIAELDRGVAELCDRLHIPYLTLAARVAAGERPPTGSDGLHVDPVGQEMLAAWEFGLIAEAWDAARR